MWPCPGAHFRVTGISRLRYVSSRKSYQAVLDSNDLLAYFYSAPVVWFYSALDTFRHSRKTRRENLSGTAFTWMVPIVGGRLPTGSAESMLQREAHLPNRATTKWSRPMRALRSLSPPINCGQSTSIGTFTPGAQATASQETMP